MRARAGRVAHFGELEPAQEFLVVLAPLPELAAPVAVALERFAHREVMLGRMLRAVQQRRDAADHFVLAPAGHARERGIDRDEAELEIGHRQRFGHAADDFLRDAMLAIGRARRHDVARGAAHAQRLAFLVALDDARAREHPDPVAAARTQAMLRFERFGRAGDVLVDALTHGRQIVRMDVLVDPRLRARSAGPRAAIAQQLAEAGHDQRIALHVPVPELVARAPERKAQAVLALAQIVAMALELLRGGGAARAMRTRPAAISGERIEELRLGAGPPRRRHDEARASPASSFQ